MREREKDRDCEKHRALGKERKVLGALQRDGGPKKRSRE